jgi:hypothetical protein
MGRINFLVMKPIIFLFLFLFASEVWSQQGSDRVVITDRTLIYSSPNASSETKGILKKGKRLKTYGEQGEFLKIHLKGGQTAFVKASDLDVPEASLEDDENLVDNGDNFKRWNMQIGVSSGSSGGRSYSEVNLGIGYYFFRWLLFQNSLFASFNRVENIYGLDSSLRGVLNTDLGGIGHLHLFAGPGYRVASDGDYNTVFTEAGLVTTLMGFSLGGGVKTFYYSMKNANYANENQYFIILSGGAVF